jgi:CBS domain-containing protein
MMAEHKYGAAIVLDRGEVKGIFTTIDALRALLDLLVHRGRKPTGGGRAAARKRRAPNPAP